MPRGDWVLQERLSFLFSRTPPLKRGELVAYLKPTDPSAVVLKRVAALEGDTVLVDPTGWSGDHEKTREVRIPKGHVWLLGDNPEASIDSREYGPVPIGLVKGRIVAKVRLYLALWRPSLALTTILQVFPSPEILLPRSS